MKRSPLYRGLEWTGFRFWFRHLYRVEVEHAERIPATGPLILVANHESMLDPFLLGLVTRRQVRYMAKAELWRSRVIGPAMEAFGCFPIERGTGDRQAVGRAEQLLDEGQVLGTFPQGTCLPYRDRPWFRGAARLALMSGTPIMPVCIVGSERALRPRKFKLGLPRVKLIVGEPIPIEAAKPSVASAKALTARIEEAVEELGAPYGPPAHAWYPPGATRKAA
ncbi:MAG TPA: lysophospholipid acyltransferase family protein [Gaiellaceae bacterium]|jgi:1-acyl-sn-glycerol-3-phosphate acyltransferase|nr:lysophospholipid acyltransferase family protein [Gaiellaceae bacterium]